MTNVRQREHFNLYYIFKEDKELKALSQNVIADLWTKVLLKATSRRSPEI